MIVTLWIGSAYGSSTVSSACPASWTGHPLLLVADDHRPPLAPHQDLVLGELEVHHPYGLAVVPGGVERRLVHQVRQVRPGEPGGPARQHGDVDVVSEGDLLGVDAEDALASPDVGAIDHDPAIEATRAQQRRVEHVRAVGRRNQDDAFVRLEAVHLHQQLVQRLLALVVAAAEPGPAVPADGIDLVDEHDAGRVLLALLEQVTDPRGPDADEHLDEVGAADREEGDVRLARHRAREQRLAGSGRPHQQDPLRDPPAELLESLRLLEELDDLLQFLLGLVHAGHVLEGDLLLRARRQPGLAFPNDRALFRRSASASSGRSETDHQQDRGQEQQRGLRLACSALEGDGHALVNLLPRPSNWGGA
jgi:hypothetical protein